MNPALTTRTLLTRTARISMLKPVLDALSVSPVAAYDVRRLRTAYVGPLVRVVRSSDSAQKDFGWNEEGILDIASVAAWVGAGDGSIAIWYDQSGNGNNLTQSSTSARPRLISVDVVQTRNGRPAFYMNGSRFMDATLSSSISVANLTANAVCVMNSASGSSSRYASLWVSGSQDDNATTTAALIMRNVAANGLLTTRNATALGNKACSTGQLLVATSLFDGANNTMYVNGSAGTAVASTGNFGANLLRLGDGSAAANKWTGFVCSLILFASALSGADRTALEANEKLFFGTP